MFFLPSHTPPMRLPGVPTNIEGLEGPIALSQFFAWGLDGILFMQVCFYYFAFPNDKLTIKWLVWSVFLTDIVTTIFGTTFAYTSLAAGWGDLDALYKIPWSLPPMPIVCGLIASAVQIFYCWRIWVLSHNMYVPGFLVLISVAQFTAGTYCGIHLATIDDFRQLDQNTLAATVWLAGSAFCDFCITTFMVFLLFQRRQNATKYTESMINKIITYTIETGLIPAISALCELVFFFASTTTNVHLIFFYMLAKLYSNSMMANLNSRRVVSSDYLSSTNSTSGFWKHSLPGSSVLDSVRLQQTLSSSGYTSETTVDIERNIVGACGQIVEASPSIDMTR